MMTARNLTLALPKGRVLEEAVALFKKAGVDLSAITAKTRRLVFDLHLASSAAEPPRSDSPRSARLAGIDQLRVLVVRDADVPTYVERGVADLGIAGRDVLEEQGRDLYEPLDLKIGACRLCVAEPEDARPHGEHLRYATKFPNLTRRHLEKNGIVADVIKLSGSVELGPITGLSDRIVDLVSSGETLRQHHLREVETLMDITARLVVNRASLKVRRQAIDSLLSRLRSVV